MELVIIILFDLLVWITLLSSALSSAPHSLREHNAPAATDDFTLYTGFEGLTG